MLVEFEPEPEVEFELAKAVSQVRNLRIQISRVISQEQAIEWVDYLFQTPKYLAKGVYLTRMQNQV